jgi:cytochrome c553
MIKKILIGLLLVLAAIQFIRPAKNLSAELSANDISRAYPIPAEMQDLLKTSCADCHSNNTVYPWYSKVQPVAWWLANHVNEGKKELNFSEFGTYSPKKQAHKLKEVIEQVKEGEMPLNSYTWVHKNATLTDDQKLAISSWAEALRKEIAAKNNLDLEALEKK